MDAIMQWGIGVVLAVQGLGGLEGIMEVFTFLGTEEFFLLLLPALYWCVDAALGARLAVVLITSSALNALFKLVFHLPRPYWIDARVDTLSAETSYGLPSGHAQNAVAVWGFLARQASRAWIWIAALALIFFISLSRLYLGVHFPTDILGGWVIGGGLLWALVRWERSASAWLRGLGLWPQIGLAFAVSMVYLALTAGILAAIAPAPDPAAWETTAAAEAPPDEGEPAIDPRAPEGSVNSAGTLLGLGAGLALMAHPSGVRFDARGLWWKRVLRFVAGLIGVLFFWRGLDLVFPSDPFLVGMAFRYVRYALTVFWVLYLAPWVFVKTRLAEAIIQEEGI